MTILLEVNGVQYTQFKSANVSIRLDALTNTFSFEATSEDGNPLPFRGGESCKIEIEGQTVLTGNIEIVEVNYDATQHTIAISGRDKTGDLLDSTLDSISDLVAPITLKQIIEKVIEHLELDIQVVDNFNPEPFNRAEDIIAPDPAQNAFEFIEQYARKRQVLLTSNGEGNIVITQSESEVINSPIRHLVNNNVSNILQASVSYDSTGRYNLYKFASSLNPLVLSVAGRIGLTDLVDQKGQKIDEEIRRGRQLILIAENAFSNKQNEDRATWEANIRKARGRVYSVVLKKFTNNLGGLWEINTLISIIDDFAGINANMLINSISFNFNLSSGRQTTLGFINQNAYKLTLEEPKTEEIGSGLFG